MSEQIQKLAPVRLDAKFVASLAKDQDRELLVRDTETKGFYVRRAKSGRVSFGVAFSFAGRERRMHLGTYPELTVQAARALARSKRASAMHGIDPLKEREDARLKAAEIAAAPDIGDLRSLYFNLHVLGVTPNGQPNRTPAGIKNETRYWRDIEKQLGTRTKLDALTRQDVERLHRTLSSKAPVNANRVVASLRCALGIAINEHLIVTNPATSVKLNPEAGRERYLDLEEVRRLRQAILSENDRASALIVWLALLTGARRGELLKAKWADLDFTKGLWVKPASTTKQRRTHRLPLSPDAIHAFKTIKELGLDTVNVAPGQYETALTRLKRAWNRIREAAGLADVRLHDLRHAHASLLISNGFGLEIVGAALGHTQAQTTMRYAHLMDTKLRSAVNTVSELSSDSHAALH